MQTKRNEHKEEKGRKKKEKLRRKKERQIERKKEIKKGEIMFSFFSPFHSC